MNETSIEETLETQVGGIAYFLRFIAVYMPYTVLTGVGTVVGTLGNLLIIGAVICCKELQNSTNMFVVNLSLSDLFISSFVNSFTFVGIFAGKSFFDANPFLCNLIGASCLVACVTSLMNIGGLAFNRYINICHHHLYEKWFSKKLTAVYCLLTWLIGLAMDVPNLTGWGGHYYDEKSLVCVWNRLASQSYSIFFPMSSIIIPSILILYFYIRIFVFASMASKRAASQQSKKEFKKSLKIAFGLFASFMLFFVCWVPFGFIVMIDFHDQLPMTVHAYFMMFAHLNSSLNPVLYAVCNPAFQRGYKQLILRLICRPNSVRNATVNLHKSQKTHTKV
nr:G protein-coupled receptor [Proales similis]